MRIVASQILNAIIDHKLEIQHCEQEPEGWAIIAGMGDYSVVMTTAAPYRSLQTALWREGAELTQWERPLTEVSSCLSQAAQIVEALNK